MPNRCARCGKLHPDSADYILNGCDECGSKFFFFVKEKDIERIESELRWLSKSEVSEIERDIREIISEETEIKPDDTVVLDVEAIWAIKPGKYRIDIVNLFSQRPLVVKVGPGKYLIDLRTLLPRLLKKTNK
ncbi:MAG: Zn-ribbon containing protein [Candidatus Aenigmatarchaeota archaeon]